MHNVIKKYAENIRTGKITRTVRVLGRSMCMEKTSDYGEALLKDEVVRRILANEAQYIEKYGDIYDVHAINLHFTCSYSDDEIRSIGDLCLELLEELRQINANGYTREDFVKAKKESAGDKELLFEALGVYMTYANEKVEDIVDRLCKVTRVGGAYFMIMSKPGFIQGINSVYEFIIDEFDDARMYFSAIFMLIRVAMHMHSDEVKDDEK